MSHKYPTFDEDVITYMELQKLAKKKSPPSYEGELTEMVYQNAKSADRAVKDGILTWVDLAKRQTLYSDEGTLESPNIVTNECAWCPHWKSGHGAWLALKFLTKLERENEFGPVSP